MSGFLQFALITFTSVLFIVDPVAVIPTYLVITQGESPDQRRDTARRACIAAALLLVVFGIAGRLIFRVFGITLPAFRIAGGLILWLVAMDMLRGVRTTQESTEEIVEGQEKEDVAITPLAMPMLAGPGAISTVIVLAGQAKTVSEHAVVYGSVIITAFLSWITLRLGERLVSALGQTGIRVMTRIMGLLLAAVAIQFVITGVRDAIGDAKEQASAAALQRAERSGGRADGVQFLISQSKTDHVFPINSPGAPRMCECTGRAGDGDARLFPTCRRAGTRARGTGGARTRSG